MLELRSWVPQSPKFRSSLEINGSMLRQNAMPLRTAIQRRHLVESYPRILSNSNPRFQLVSPQKARGETLKCNDNTRAPVWHVSPPQLFLGLYSRQPCLARGADKKVKPMSRSALIGKCHQFNVGHRRSPGSPAN